MKVYGIVLASVIAIGCGQGVALAQQKTVIKLGWVTPDSAQDPYAIGAHAFKDAIEKKAPSRFDVQLFPNRQLGDEKPMLEGLRFGTVDAAIITNAVVAQVEPSFQVNDLPFLYANEAQAHKVLDGPVGKQLAQKLDAKGIVALGFMEGGFRQMINNVRPVTKPDDVRGVKYRVMQNPVFIDMFSSLGGNAVPMAWGETFTAVQQGTIDGLEIPAATIDSSKFNEVTKFLSVTNHTYSMTALLMSKKAYEKLPDNLKAAVREAGVAATKAQREASAMYAKQTIQALAGKGMQVNVVSDVRPFRQAVQPMYVKYRSSIGELMDVVLKEVK